MKYFSTNKKDPQRLIIPIFDYKEKHERNMRQNRQIFDYKEKHERNMRQNRQRHGKYLKSL